MSSDVVKAVARKFYEIIETGDLDAADTIVAADYVNHKALPGQKAGREGYKDVVRAIQRGLPDIRYTIEDQIAEGDKVVTRYSAAGTHTGELFGVDATGKRVTMTALVLQRVVDGRVQESWLEMDMLDLMRQMGALPA